MTRLQKLNEAVAVVKSSRTSLEVRLERIKLTATTRNNFRHRYLEATEALLCLEDALRVLVQVELTKEDV